MPKPQLKDAMDTRPEMDAFVRSGSTGTRKAISTAVQQSRRSRMKKATFNLPADLHKRLKILAAQEEREMVDILVEVLEKRLKTNGREAAA